MVNLRILSVLLLASAFFAETASPTEAQQNPPTEQMRPNPSDALRTAQTIFIRTKSVYFKPATLEETLLEQDAFQKWGFVISRVEADADLIIEVDRKLFTNEFVYSVIDPKTDRVLLAGKINSLGGTVEEKIANGFSKRLQKVRPLP